MQSVGPQVFRTKKNDFYLLFTIPDKFRWKLRQVLKIPLKHVKFAIIICILFNFKGLVLSLSYNSYSEKPLI